tara:strand:+ start:507 stop:782 length:276 start_codon:yes stop_codon:yes gene_type:complete
MAPTVIVVISKNKKKFFKKILFSIIKNLKTIKIIITPGTTAYLPPAKPGCIEPIIINPETIINATNIIKISLLFFFEIYLSVIKEIKIKIK